MHIAARLQRIIKEELQREMYDDGTKDSRGLVKALQQYVNKEMEGYGDVEVDMSDNWDGKPAYIIYQGGATRGVAYRLTGEPIQHQRSTSIAAPGQLGLKNVLKVPQHKLKKWLSGIGAEPIGPNLPPPPPLKGKVVKP